MAQQRRPRDRWMSVRTAYTLIILIVLTAYVGLRQADPAFMARLRLLGFDILQQLHPRIPDHNYPVRIIDVDDASIKSFGKWPWSRQLLARLVDKLFSMGVRVVVFDMVFPEASLEPFDQIPEPLRNSDEVRAVIEKLRTSEPADETFAKAISAHPTVLGIIGTSQTSGPPPKSKVSIATIGKDVVSFARGFSGASSNLPALEKAAAGIGLLNWFPDQDQILRRIPLVVRLSDKLYPSLVAETLRVSKRTKSMSARSAGEGGFAGDRGITSVGIGDTPISTDADGQVWLWFSTHDPKRSISAAAVLEDRAPAEAFNQCIAIIGTSAPGLLDLRATPLDPVISGVEINAQAIEQLLANRQLIRPDYAVGMEIVLTVVSGFVLAVVVYLSGAGMAAIVGFASVCTFLLGAYWAFFSGILIDAVFPIMTTSAAYIFGTGYLYYEAERERDGNREALQRIAREMESAAQIQRTFLPNDIPTGPHAAKFDIYGLMKPAKTVGGDFYDYFLINDRKLGFAVGDVSGKGVPAALFMSVSRTVLRTIAFEDVEPGLALSKTNAILARDNTEGMFVTIFYAVLDLETGQVLFSSAGHDDALLITDASNCEALNFMGPAIGLFDAVEYPTAMRKLAAGDTMLLLTDGITEAFNIDGRVFGVDRLIKSSRNRKFASATELVNSITDDVTRFADGNEQSDDITCIAVRFNG